MSIVLRSVLTVLVLSQVSLAQEKWCNKNYQADQPIVPPGGQFEFPELSDAPLLSLRCGQAIRPYIASDLTEMDAISPLEILVDSPIVQLKIDGASPIDLGSEKDPKGTVVVSIDGQTVAQGIVPLNTTKASLPLTLRSLNPQAGAYNLTCSLTYGDQTFTATSTLTYLPDPGAETGSVTKMDMRTGALLARPPSGEGPYQRVFPVGFYTNFGSYLSQNLSVIAELKDQGFNMIHPVPTFDNLTALEEVLDEMERVGLYLMYDMRWSYQNSTQVTEEINRVRTRKNLLLWYTADEPDGWGDPLNATTTAYNLITSLDGGDGRGGSGYHPISLVLNCENYEFTTYSSGADIIMTDAYTIGNNVTFSTEWGTECTEDYGDCGCDNCKGSFADISDRLDAFRDRFFVNEWTLTKSVWTVPQAFGNSSYWKRYPTGRELVVQSIAGLNHGALGVVPWDDAPTTTEIKASASAFALAIPKMSLFILDPATKVRQISVDGVDIGIWTTDSGTLLVATNFEYAEVSIDLAEKLGVDVNSGVDVVLESGGQVNSSNILTLEPAGSIGIVLSALSAWAA